MGSCSNGKKQPRICRQNLERFPDSLVFAVTINNSNNPNNPNNHNNNNRINNNHNNCNNKNDKHPSAGASRDDSSLWDAAQQFGAASVGMAKRTRNEGLGRILYRFLYYVHGQ